MSTDGRRLLLTLAATLAGVAVVVIGVTGHVARPFTVAGRSMSPTLEPGDRVVVDLWTYRGGEPAPGDVVLFRGPEGVLMVKRIALPPAYAVRPSGRLLPVRPDEPTYWVLGDNPVGSTDSRQFGTVPRHRIVGRVAWRYWPPSDFGSIR